jgi:hypothetical protein
VTVSSIETFARTHQQLLEALLAQHRSAPETEALIHALVDIASSVEKIYGELIPQLHSHLQTGGAFGQKATEQTLWDVFDEFRHIDYHIHDGILRGREVSPPWVEE